MSYDLHYAPGRYWTVEIQRINPETAEEWLKLPPAVHLTAEGRLHVEATAAAMTAGTWVPRANAVAFDWHGRRVGGDRLLLAIIQSGTTQPALLIHHIQPLDPRDSRPVLPAVPPPPPVEEPPELVISSHTLSMVRGYLAYKAYGKIKRTPAVAAQVAPFIDGNRERVALCNRHAYRAYRRCKMTGYYGYGTAFLLMAEQGPDVAVRFFQEALGTSSTQARSFDLAGLWLNGEIGPFPDADSAVRLLLRAWSLWLDGLPMTAEALNE